MESFNQGITLLNPGAEFLRGRGANETSQFGEDGLVAAWLERYPPRNQWCFEVGAADGFHLSNTAALRRQGWTAVLIEGDAEQYEKLRELRSDKVITIPKRISHDTLDALLTGCGAPRDIDFGVIDIDGQDYWAFEGLKLFRPRLLLVEFDYRSDDGPVFIPHKDGLGQASYQAILKLGNEKNYTAIAKTICNVLFADMN